MRALAVVAAVALAASALSCAGGGGGDRLTVLAAASLERPFAELARAFEESRPGTDVVVDLAGTPQLVARLAEGGPGDVLATADEESMARAAAEGAVGGRPRRLAGNALALVVAPGNPEGIRGLADLARPELVVALCAPEVPAGRYARRALARAGVEARPDTLETGVTDVVGRVALGEADVGVAYRTDVLAARGRVDGVDVPAAHQVEAVYEIATVDPEDEAAAAFVALATGPEGRAVLARAGFTAP